MVGLEAARQLILDSGNMPTCVLEIPPGHGAFFSAHVFHFGMSYNTVKAYNTASEDNIALLGAHILYAPTIRKDKMDNAGTNPAEGEWAKVMGLAAPEDMSSMVEKKDPKILKWLRSRTTADSFAAYREGREEDGKGKRQRV